MATRPTRYLERSNVSETSDLALCVINDGASCQKRLDNCRTMTKRHYRAFVLTLITAEVRRQRIQFGVPQHKHGDIERAVSEVIDHMERHVAEFDLPENPNYVEPALPAGFLASGSILP
jgi:hypothetical protein